MKIYTSKPELPKQDLKELRKVKWQIAEDHSYELRRLGFNVLWFNSSSTPHLRIKDCDYWPASSRWYDFTLKQWGVGVEDLKSHLLYKRTLKNGKH